jgi:hypothetical protein
VQLTVNHTRVSDLSPLKGMPLTYLNCDETRVADLSPLEGAKLEKLYCAFTRVKDLSPLEGMPLELLHCSFTGVDDLSPLKGAPLERLQFASTNVSDLGPLRGMKLKALACSQTRVADLAVIKGMPLTSLTADIPLYGAGLIESLPLKRVNNQAAADCWKEIDGKRKAAEAFARETAAKPAEQQHVAVAKKLEELNDGKIGGLGRVIRDDAVVAATLALDRGTHDLTPLMALQKLETLTLTGGPQWLDLSPLKHLPLEELTVGEDLARKNVATLRAMKTLKTINGKPAHEFWTK